tara:strand:+ start:108 stop:611 length:504 start_codon:yes stop_codon:yes gene_type:complete
MKNLAKQGKNFVVKNVKAHELILAALLLLYIFSGVSTPNMVVPVVNNVISYVVAFIITTIVFFSVNPLVGILFGISFYVLFQRTPNLNNLESSEERKAEKLAEINSGFSIPLKFPRNARGEVIQTRDDSNILEVDIVERMAPANSMPVLGNGSFEPIQAGGINATTL